MHRPIRTFLLHYLSMVAAMLVGMLIIFPVWVVATRGVPSTSWLVGVEMSSLVMATTMTLPMAAWMRIRRHRWSPVLEMSAAMYAGFVLLFPFYWLSVLDADGVMIIGHVLMLVLMAGAMLLRRTEYTSHQHRSHLVDQPVG